MHLSGSTGGGCDGTARERKRLPEADNAILTAIGLVAAKETSDEQHPDV